MIFKYYYYTIGRNYNNGEKIVIIKTVNQYLVIVNLLFIVAAILIHEFLQKHLIFLAPIFLMIFVGLYIYNKKNYKDNTIQLDSDWKNEGVSKRLAYKFLTFVMILSVLFLMLISLSIFSILFPKP